MTLAEHVILYLAWLRSGEDIDKLSVILKIKPSTGEAAIARFRHVINDMLEREWAARRRPRPLTGHFYCHVALLVDSTTIPINKPLGRFSESKIFFDGKNHVYGIKKEVAVMASSPHYAMFVNKGEPGSRHDYEILKEGYHRYLEYLMKTPEEEGLFTDNNCRQWSALFDNGYQGPLSDTPGLRRMFVPRRSASPAEEAVRTELAKLIAGHRNTSTWTLIIVCG